VPPFGSAVRRWVPQKRDCSARSQLSRQSLSGGADPKRRRRGACAAAASATPRPIARRGRRRPRSVTTSRCDAAPGPGPDQHLARRSFNTDLDTAIVCRRHRPSCFNAERDRRAGLAEALSSGSYELLRHLTAPAGTGPGRRLGDAQPTRDLPITPASLDG